MSRNYKYDDITWNFNKKNQNKTFLINGWIKNPNNTAINSISASGASIWINLNGELCYRFGIHGKIQVSTTNKASIAFSTFLGGDIEIGKKKSSTYIIDNTNKKPIYLSTNDLNLIEDEHFSPNYFQDFYYFQNLLYRNSYIPSSFQLNSENSYFNYQNSIIGQYIYFLANYNEDRFHYIMHWLASFFQNPSRKSNITLVLVGKNDSGLEILFNEIIMPLFECTYCIKINDDRLKMNNLTTTVKNRIFYNIDNISNSIVADEGIKRFLNNLIHNDTGVINVKNRDSIVDVELFGQILVTTYEKYLPYINSSNNDYTVFYVPNNIEDIVRGQKNIYGELMDIEIKKIDLIKMIADDLQNFSNILKFYQTDNRNHDVFGSDDKALIITNEEDKLKEFSDAIIYKNRDYFDKLKDLNVVLFEDIMKDFDNNRVKQSNLLKCYTEIYRSDSITSSRTLMVKLRKINNNFFKKEAIQPGAGGIKYFHM